MVAVVTLCQVPENAEKFRESIRSGVLAVVGANLRFPQSRFIARVQGLTRRFYLYARAISFITAPNKRTELCSLIENTVTPIVREHKGFLDHVTLISDEEPRLVM